MKGRNGKIAGCVGIRERILYHDTFKDLVEITAKLRAEDGCPWDREQTFESLRKYMREEAEEAVQAVDEWKDMGKSVVENWGYEWIVPF